MVQESSVRKAGRGFGFLESLFEDANRSESKKDLEFLRKDYVDLIALSASLSSHSKWIPYLFLIERIKKTADELRGISELLRGKILELGGQVPTDASGMLSPHDNSLNDGSAANYLSRQNVKRLVKDMEVHSSCCEALQRQRNLIRDGGVARLLTVVIADMQRQKAELLDVVMKIS
ncbi:MAG TPA: hypothetical protein VLX91_06970 [Candidatus Acidoferrales bacterium]|nr:hypothetical protein [Candidatus Acidoferrales bacterium]